MPNKYYLREDRTAVRPGGVYKIEVVKMGMWLPYVYKRRFFFWWRFVRVGNFEPLPYWGSALDLQTEYNVPDKRFYILNEQKQTDDTK